jgi:WD40 repeat protein
MSPQRSEDFFTVGGYGRARDGQPASNGFTAVAWAPDSRRLAAGFTPGEGWQLDPLRIWDAETGTRTQGLMGNVFPSRFEAISWSPDGQHLAAIGHFSKSGPPDTTLKVWNPSSGEETKSISFGANVNIDNGAGCLAFSPDSKRLAVRLKRRDSVRPVPAEFRIWDLNSWHEAPPADLLSRVHAPRVILAPDWRRAAFADDLTGNCTLWVRDLAGAQQVSAPEKIGPTHSMAWSPGSTRLAYLDLKSRPGRAVKIWDISGDKPLLTCRGNTEEVFSLAWSPDGRRLASAGLDRTVRIWETTDGKELLTLPAPNKWIWSYSLAWSPDGKRLAAGGANGEVRVWDAPGYQTQVGIKDPPK